MLIFSYMDCDGQISSHEYASELQPIVKFQTCPHVVSTVGARCSLFRWNNDLPLTDEATVWLRESCEHKYIHLGNGFMGFESEDEAFRFKLFWL
jgi:hypothetical protein